MTLVVDASVALKWLLDEMGSIEAQALLASPDLLIAPDLIVAEFCNAGCRLRRTRPFGITRATRLRDIAGAQSSCL